MHAIWSLIPAFAVGGAERTPVALGNNLDRDRYDVTIWTMFDANPLADRVEDYITLRSPAGALSTETAVVCGVRAVPNRPSPLYVTLDRLTMPLANAVVSTSAAGANLAEQLSIGATWRTRTQFAVSTMVSNFGRLCESFSPANGGDA